MAKKTYYITTPIYYVNDQPHIGHAYTTTVADCLARFMRLDGYDVKMLTGTDEHGQKVQAAAEKEGVPPLEFVDKVSQNFRELFTEMTIQYDDFIRTTEQRHIKAAQHLWRLLKERDQIYLGSYAGWYSVRDEAFYPESDIVDGKAPTGAPVTWVEEPSYFFRLSDWQEPLLEWYEKHPDFISPASRRNEVISFVKSGLRDLSISRTTFDWGVPVPDDPEHVMYVWFDALTNYISALGYPEKKGEFEEFWPANVHMVGKDIVRFHGVYWPAMILAAGLKPPTKIFAHGFWTHEGEKMSKSLGNGIDPYILIEKYGIDQTRFFLLREVILGNDGDFSYASFVNRVNSNLANDLGNLVQRVLSMIQKNCDGVLPKHGPFIEEDEDLLNMALSMIDEVRGPLFEKQDISRYCDAVWHVIGAANRYVDQQAPWALRKSNFPRMETVLYVLAEVIRYVGILLQPIMPQAATKILDFLSVPLDARTFSALTVGDALKPGIHLPKPSPVFPRIVEEDSHAD